MRFPLLRISAYVLLALMPLFASAQEEQKPAVVFMGDRTIIYIDRLPLQGDETLLDVLQIYPELLVKGFEDIIANYQVRMDNTAIFCDVRQYLANTPARNIRTMQIVETPSVAKGVTGIGGVIDLNPKSNEEGTHGFVGLEMDTKGGVSPFTAINSGIKHPQGSSTDIYGSASFNDHSRHGDTNLGEHATVNITHHFGAKDRMILFLRQGYSRSDYEPMSSSNRDYMAHLYHYHTFNDIGTMLLLVAGYRYQDDRVNYDPKPLYAKERSTTGLQTYVAELNTPLPFLGGTQLMLGWEGDFIHLPYNLRQAMTDNSATATGSVTKELSFHDNYTISVNDFYLMLDYRLGPVTLSAGDRVSVYHYGMEASGSTASYNPVRHTPMGTIVANLAPSHQLRGGYARRFINPSFLSVLPTSYPARDGQTWISYTHPATEERADVYSLAYSYSHSSINGNLSAKYTHFTNIDENTLQVNAAVDWRRDCFSLTAGASLCHSDAFGDKKTYTYIRLAPTVRFSHDWRVSAQGIWRSAKAPERAILDDAAVYTLLSVSKTFARHIALTAQWHDIFNSNRSAALITAKYLF